MNEVRTIDLSVALCRVISCFVVPVVSSVLDSLESMQVSCNVHMLEEDYQFQQVERSKVAKMACAAEELK